MCMGPHPIFDEIMDEPWAENDYVAADLSNPWTVDDRDELIRAASIAETWQQLLDHFPNRIPEDVEAMTAVCFGRAYVEYLKEGAEEC